MSHHFKYGGSTFDLLGYLLKSSNDGKVGNHVDLVELLVDHKAKDSELGSTAVVELNGALGKLGLLIKGVPSKVKGTITEVSREVTGFSTVGRVLHDEKLKEANEGNNLKKTSLGDGIRAEKGGSTIRVGVEGVTGEVDVSRKVDSGAGDNLAKEGKLCDTSVLELDVTKTVKSLLVGIIEEAKRIVESKRLLGSELSLEGIELGAGGLLGSRGEGSSRGDKGRKDGELHLEFLRATECVINKFMSWESFVGIYLEKIGS
mmetsp:Transcript_15081/g.20532  ORF Transcript_15081/g.20532 Transcript_15081/m.20532 type:complete len:260 (-) Transcript_15081:3-782(-)